MKARFCLRTIPVAVTTFRSSTYYNLLTLKGPIQANSNKSVYFSSVHRVYLKTMSLGPAVPSVDSRHNRKCHCRLEVVPWPQAAELLCIYVFVSRFQDLLPRGRILRAIKTGKLQESVTPWVGYGSGIVTIGVA